LITLWHIGNRGESNGVGKHWVCFTLNADTYLDPLLWPPPTKSVAASFTCRFFGMLMIR